VLAVPLDVAEMEQWQAVAEQALARFGKLHMLINNAGVGGTAGGVEGADEKEWRWVVDVNLMGVAFGAQVIVPHIKSHGEGGWVINVASMAGFGPLPLAGPYTATKAAVVALTECWRSELAAHNIKASVLCPGFVKTRIHESSRNKQARYADGSEQAAQAGGDMGGVIESVVTTGMDAAVVGERVVEALLADELYIFTHPNYRPSVKARWQAVDEAFERAEQSPLLAGDVVPELPFGS
jgi:NAD(P)-dependent dehydrogenase (short-subunit alcohol dehydrogenase family)